MAKSLWGRCEVQNQVILRVTEAETAKWAADQLGEAEIERANRSSQMGPGSQRDGVSVSQQQAREHIVMASELRSLEDCEAHFSTVGQAVRKIKYGWKERRMERNEAGFVASKKDPEPIAPAWLSAEVVNQG